MKHIIRIADFKISSEPDDVLITYALGSCMGISVYDPVAQVGGLIHVMLPLSNIDPEKARSDPAMFIDTGVPKLFKACYGVGAEKERMQVKVAGGACLHADPGEDQYQIGKRNVLMLKKLLWKNSVLIHAQDTGGEQSRTMQLDMKSGQVHLKVGDEDKVI